MFHTQVVCWTDITQLKLCVDSLFSPWTLRIPALPCLISSHYVKWRLRIKKPLDDWKEKTTYFSPRYGGCIDVSERISSMICPTWTQYGPCEMQLNGSCPLVRCTGKEVANLYQHISFHQDCKAFKTNLGSSGEAVIFSEQGSDYLKTKHYIIIIINARLSSEWIYYKLLLLTKKKWLL
jgi:hypothetical protein